VLCDGGGSNSASRYVFKEALQALADRLGVEIRVAHYPPYCSKYNPIENLWHYLRSHYWSNRVYPTWDALKVAAADGLVAVGTDADRIRTVCAAPYLPKPYCAEIK